MTNPVPLDSEMAAELTPKEQEQQIRAAKPKGWAQRYPKPEQADVEELYARLLPLFQPYRTLVEVNRLGRYLMDEAPAKQRKRMQGARRFRSRMAHNETLRVAAMVTRNAPKIRVPQAGQLDKDEKRGDKQSRWSNNFFPSIERRSSRPVLRRAADAMAGDGMGVLEFYLTEESVYDTLETEPKEIYDPRQGARRTETAGEVMDRTDAALQGAPLPFGLRYVDPLAVLFDEDEDGICAALIIEQKPYRSVYNKIKARTFDDPAKDPQLPRPGTFGWPVSSSTRGGTLEDGSSNWFSSELAGGDLSNATSSVLTMRYYDRRWYMYIVGGVCVDTFSNRFRMTFSISSPSTETRGRSAFN